MGSLGLSRRRMLSLGLSGCRQIAQDLERSLGFGLGRAFALVGLTVVIGSSTRSSGLPEPPRGGSGKAFG